MCYLEKIIGSCSFERFAIDPFLPNSNNTTKKNLLITLSNSYKLGWFHQRPVAIQLFYFSVIIIISWVLCDIENVQIFSISSK